MSLLDAFIEEDLLAGIAKAEVYLALRSDGVTGDGSRGNPLDASTSDKLDAILDSRISSYSRRNVRFCFGPGIFRTKGGRGPGRIDYAWEPLPGQEFIGAGMNATVLRLELESAALNTGYYVISSVASDDGHTPGLVISDMTIDLDMEHQPSTPPYDYARIMCAAISVRGDHIRIKRVRVINAGTRTPCLASTHTLDRFAFILLTPPRGGCRSAGRLFVINHGVFHSRFWMFPNQLAWRFL